MGVTIKETHTLRAQSNHPPIVLMVNQDDSNRRERKQTEPQGRGNQSE